jgi:aromatic ring-opening dioxygenase catalytic subunit (LigB family)
MANLIGCLAMSHAPQLMLNPDHWGLLNNREKERLPDKPELDRETAEVKWAKWNGCMDAIAKLRQKLEAFDPDVLIVVGDDQHENLVDDNMPPFSIYMGEEVEASTSLRYLKQSKSDNRTEYRVDAKLAESLIAGLMDEGFDPAYSKRTRYDGGLGHAFARVLKFLTPDATRRIIPVMVNTYYPPAPSAHRCAQFGVALAKLIDRFPSADRVVVIGSGGLSHTKIDEQLDERFIRALQHNDTDYMSAMPASLLVEGTSEIRNWIVTAAAANCQGTMVDYFPLYRTRTGVGCAMGFAYWQLN